MLGSTRCVCLIKGADPLGKRSEADPVVLFFPEPPPFFGEQLFFLHADWTLSGSEVTKSISVDDSHPFVDVPCDYPEWITSGASLIS
jgi:hypothetical protein